MEPHEGCESYLAPSGGVPAAMRLRVFPPFPDPKEKGFPTRGGLASRKQRRILALSKILEVALKMLETRLRKLGLLSVEQEGGRGARVC